jgi:hypothetical protein
LSASVAVGVVSRAVLPGGLLAQVVVLTEHVAVVMMRCGDSNWSGFNACSASCGYVSGDVSVCMCG